MSCDSVGVVVGKVARGKTTFWVFLDDKSREKSSPDLNGKKIAFMFISLCKLLVCADLKSLKSRSQTLLLENLKLGKSK